MAVKLAIATLAAVARSAITCHACFTGDSLNRSFVDLAQPRFVGPGYATADPRIVWLMINPGAGSADQRNQSWRACLHRYRDGSASLDDVYAEQRRHMPYWNRLLPFLDLHGFDVDTLALVNVAWCATAGDQYPDTMLERCWQRHTRDWLVALEPDVVVLSGRPAQAFGPALQEALPALRVVDTFHYAYWSRPFGRQKAATRAAEIRQKFASAGR